MNSLVATDRFELNCCSRCGAEPPPHGPAQLCPRCAWVDALETPPVEEAVAPLDLSDILLPAMERRCAQLLIGQVINGRYKLSEQLGEGGMAIVFAAQDLLRGGQGVALKVIKNRLSAQDHKLFTREFRAASTIRHDYCIRVLEFGETPDFLFFTMELFRGEWLTSLYGQPRPLIFNPN
ncbi:MAG: hypothetical protein NT154_19430 [Verrucomicrobia bacterium]|nr:hypothetical protein [Verrucomicrobiota bacterium]